MSSPELHADDLLDREARGALSREERARLEEHLAVCAVCRFERAVRADFRAEFEALGAGRPEEPPAEKSAAARPSRRPRPGRLRLLALVAVFLLLAGVAAAELSGARVLAHVPWVSAWRQPATPASSSGYGRRERSARASAVSATPLRSASAPAASAAAVTEPVASAPARAPVEGPKPAPFAPPRSSASDLFEEARVAREQGEYGIAVERYERLLALYPSSPQALTAHAVLGRLLLDRGDPRAALRHFDAYLSAAGTTLGEEALLGRALAFGKLGQSMQEAEAWHALLRAYPSSLHGARARERLNVLPAE